MYMILFTVSCGGASEEIFSRKLPTKESRLLSRWLRCASLPTVRGYYVGSPCDTEMAKTNLRDCPPQQLGCVTFLFRVLPVCE